MHISGQKIDLSNRSKWVGLIGSRNGSQSELDATYNLGKYLVSKGYIVVSGLADGMDAAGHRGALDGGGLTIAIVNTPSSQIIYPKVNIGLGERIKMSGCILHPFDNKAREDKSENPSHFIKRLLERDRLLAYLCPKIVAVCDNETIKGGTRYAVKYGMEYGNEVWRYSSEGKYYKNPKHDYCSIGWEMELDMENVLA
jgi:DNA processing protein